MIQLNIDAILSELRKKGYEADIQAETQQVYTILKISGREYPLFLRIFDEGQLLQLIVFIPSQLQKEAISDIARLLHILNKELDVPGFGMDEMAGVVFYRLMIPSNKKKIDPELLHTFIKTAEQVCTMFAVPIEAVAQGKMSLEEILQKAQEMHPE